MIYKKMQTALSLFPAIVVANLAQAAETVTPAGVTVYVTRHDCAQLVAHQPIPSAAFQPGIDVHGKPVAPADLPGGGRLDILSDRVTFDLKINPLDYGAKTKSANSLANTALPVARIDVDLLSGALRINGRSLDGEQSAIVSEACRRSGFR